MRLHRFSSPHHFQQQRTGNMLLSHHTTHIPHARAYAHMSDVHTHAHTTLTCLLACMHNCTHLQVACVTCVHTWSCHTCVDTYAHHTSLHTPTCSHMCTTLVHLHIAHACTYKHIMCACIITSPYTRWCTHCTYKREHTPVTCTPAHIHTARVPT